MNRQFPDGIDGQDVSLMADNGCQPTSLAFMRACAAMANRGQHPAAVPAASLFDPDVIGLRERSDTGPARCPSG